MKKVRKLLLCLAAAVFALAGFVGCGSGRPPREQPQDISVTVDPAISATLKIRYKNENKERQIVEAVAKELQKQFPNVKFEIDGFTGSAANAMVQYYNSNDMPDIFYADSFDMTALSMTNNLLLNFTPYIELEKANGTFDQADYYEECFKLGQNDFDGDQLLIPRSNDRVLVHYNKTKIKAVDPALLDRIHNGWTWDDFEAVCDALHAADANKILCDSNWDWEAVWNPVFIGNGVQYFDDAGKFNVKTQAMHDALDQMKSWVDKKIIAKPASGQAADFDYKKGYFLFTSRPLSYTKSKLGTDEFDVVTFPVHPDNPKIGTGIAGYSAYSGTANPDLCWQFMKTLLSKEGQNAITDGGEANYCPVRKDMADYTDTRANHWGEGYTDYNLAAYTYNSGETPDGAATPNPNWNCYTDYFFNVSKKHAVALNDKMADFISTYLRGVKSFESAANWLHSEVDALIRQR